MKRLLDNQIARTGSINGQFIMSIVSARHVADGQCHRRSASAVSAMQELAAQQFPVRTRRPHARKCIIRLGIELAVLGLIQVRPVLSTVSVGC